MDYKTGKIAVPMVKQEESHFSTLANSDETQQELELLSSQDIDYFLNYPFNRDEDEVTQEELVAFTTGLVVATILVTSIFLGVLLIKRRKKSKRVT